jgi:hypothetical protein
MKIRAASNVGSIRLIAKITAVCVLLAAGQRLSAEQPVNMNAWLQDFHQLIDEVSLHYANFEWVAQDRRVNLGQLKSRTEGRLSKAKSDEEAQDAIESFLKAFGDAHVEIQWKSSGGNLTPQPPTARSFCDRLGYNWQDTNGGIDWSIFPGFTAVHDAESQEFPAGLLHLTGNRVVGVVRIGWFSEYAHPALCAVAQREKQISEDSECSDTCRDQFQFAVGDLLDAALERRVESLAKMGAGWLLVDTTGNGGGTNWVEPAARILTPIPLNSPRYAFVKHEHWVDQLRQRLRVVEADLSDAPADYKSMLTGAAATLRDALEKASTPCAMNGLWAEPPQPTSCSMLVSGLLYVSGILPYAKPGSLSSLKSNSVLFYPSRYQYHEGANRLPLIVLVDGDTGSSAEYFAAMLQDNKAATIVGTVTVGAGCGFTQGGIPTKLRNSGATVRLSDCVRLRADGLNEVSGVTPDILLPWVERDSRYQKAAKLKRWLEMSWQSK